MPLYEYQCEACENRFERIQKFSDPPVTVCPKCGKGPVRKLISSPAIQFKGSGWYITDYARKGESSAKSDTAASGKSKDSAADSASSSDASKDTASSTRTAETSTPKPSKSE
jgi:putative FmdB family regulatory protein